MSTQDNSVRDLALIGLAAFVIFKFSKPLEETFTAGSSVVTDVSRVSHAVVAPIEAASDLLTDVIRLPYTVPYVIEGATTPAIEKAAEIMKDPNIRYTQPLIYTMTKSALSMNPATMWLAALI